MKEVYYDTEFDEQSLECPTCSWKGKGYDTNVIDLYGVSDVKEIHCPNCDQYLGGIKSRGDNPPS